MEHVAQPKKSKDSDKVTSGTWWCPSSLAKLVTISPITRVD